MLMKRSVILWVVAFILTTVLAVYQRVTGPTYPVSGTVQIENIIIDYNFNRTHAGPGNQIVRLQIGNNQIDGLLYWKRYKTADSWTIIEMKKNGDELQVILPHQPSAGKLIYKIELAFENSVYTIPQEPIVIRFRSNVPIYILIPHILFIFSAMMLSTRTGLEIFNNSPVYLKLTNWTLLFLVLGGLIFGPIMQKFAFDAFWTGFPFGHDLTDNKILIAFIGWVITAFMIKKSQNQKRWIGFASVLLFVVFLIPHSVLGSEIDYNELDKQQKKIEQMKETLE